MNPLYEELTTNEEREYNDFIWDLEKKAKELNDKFQKLSDQNKTKVYNTIKAFEYANLALWLFGNKQ